MTFRLRALILFAVLVWQSLAMLSSFSISQRAYELDHLTVHVEEANHHHHEDQSLHIDVEENSAQHFHADSGSSSNALLMAALPGLADKASMSLPLSPTDPWLSASLDGLLRPPQQIC
jgi:hypothetical protein